MGKSEPKTLANKHSKWLTEIEDFRGYEILQ